MKIRIITLGGTIDKIYYDRKNTYQIGEPQILDVLKEANVTLDFDIFPLMRKDSLEMTDQDRALVRQTIESEPYRHYIVTHGTDTMTLTAECLNAIGNKVIVLTGAMQPARFRLTDAVFNIGCAVAAVQILGDGVYIAMNGRIFTAGNVRKNVNRNCFESL